MLLLLPPLQRRCACSAPQRLAPCLLLGHPGDAFAGLNPLPCSMVPPLAVIEHRSCSSVNEKRQRDRFLYSLVRGMTGQNTSEAEKLA
jgi:hypothetical protein